jgi:thiamine pyrophosphokinase
MKSFALFLHGQYSRAELSFYKSLARGKICVAVDGGLSFFRKSGLTPDLIIGDFDSLKRRIPTRFAKIEVQSFPKAKNKTDSQLAVAHAIRAGATSIDIVQPVFGEADHFTGNLMLLAGSVGKSEARRVRLRLINATYEVFFLNNSTCHIRGDARDTLSVLAFSPTIALTCRGTEYPASKLRIRRGDSGAALRNQLTGSRAVVTVSGQAFLFHRFSQSRKTD